MSGYCATACGLMHEVQYLLSKRSRAPIYNYSVNRLSLIFLQCTIPRPVPVNPCIPRFLQMSCDNASI